MTRPVVLDFDRSVAVLDGEQRIDLTGRQDAVRFACSSGELLRLQQLLDESMPRQHGTVFTGSGDFHHVTLPLIARSRPSSRMRLVVFDNHPDNMRFPFGVHCGSWVHRVASLRQVEHVDVVGIGSPDAGTWHAWENHLGSLRSGRVSYWCVGVDTRWARWLGLRNVHTFADADTLTDAFIESVRSQPRASYVSIDKDVLSPEDVQTNWDQGNLRLHHLFAMIAALRGSVIGSDITGDVSIHRYRNRLKRLLSALDQQPQIPAARIAEWQARHDEVNRTLLGALLEASA